MTHETDTIVLLTVLLFAYMNRLSRDETWNWQILKKHDLTLVNQKAKNIKIYEKIIEFHIKIWK